MTPARGTMKESAVVRNGKDIIKVINLKRKYNKIINNPIMEIIEECTKEELESKYLYYKDFYEEKEEDECKVKHVLTYWNIPGTRMWITFNENEDPFKSSKWSNDYVLSIKEEYCKCFGI